MLCQRISFKRFAKLVIILTLFVTSSLVTNASAQIGVVRGLNGTHIFNTTSYTMDAGEPFPCGTPVIATYWFPINSTEVSIAKFDTFGSTSSSGQVLDTVLQVYKVPVPINNFLSYSQLISVTCNDNYSSLYTSKVAFTVQPNVQYLLQLGIKAPGRASINWSLTPAPPAPTPTPNK